MMNCSLPVTTPSDGNTRPFLSGNFGASVFMATYIGFYGLSIIIYFICQFMTDNSDGREEDIPSEFFSTFHHINERQQIYRQLTNKNWIKRVYEVYYADEPMKYKSIEERASQCSKKYHQKIEHLQSRHLYYVEASPSPAALTLAASLDP